MTENKHYEQADHAFRAWERTGGRHGLHDAYMQGGLPGEGLPGDDGRARAWVNANPYPISRMIGLLCFCGMPQGEASAWMSDVLHAVGDMQSDDRARPINTKTPKDHTTPPTNTNDTAKAEVQHA